MEKQFRKLSGISLLLGSLLTTITMAMHPVGGQRKMYAVEGGRYFSGNDGEIEEWILGNRPPSLRCKLPKLHVPRFHRPLAFWMNSVSLGRIPDRGGESTMSF